MMINRQKFAMTLGVFAAVMHLIWVVLVALNLAQPLSGFIHKMHFIDKQHMFTEFSLGRSIGLLVLAFIVAYIVGSIFATIWNKIHKPVMPKI